MEKTLLEIMAENREKVFNAFNSAVYPFSSSTQATLPVEGQDAAVGGQEAQIEGNGGSTPSQYALPPQAKELQDLIEHRNMNFAVGNIFKAAYRLGTKEGVTEEYDLRKIIFFAKREIRRIKNLG